MRLGLKHSSETIEKLRLSHIRKTGEESPNWKGGFPKCVDCNKQLAGRYAQRCKKCNGKSHSGMNHPTFVGGKPKCVDCGERLKSYVGERCQSCSMQGARNNLWKGGISKREGYISLCGVNRRARERGAEGSHTLQEWELLKKQYGFKCPCCNKKEPEINLTEDHIIPLIKGGSNYIKNIQPLCKSCNSKKHVTIITYTLD